MDNPIQIINEYEILKKILLHLNCRELIAASKVCRNWKRVADIIIQKKVEVFCCYKIEEWSEFNTLIHPKLIMYNTSSDERGDFPAPHRFKEDFTDIMEILSEHYETKDAYMINLTSWKFISTIKENSKLKICHSSTENEEYDTRTKVKETLFMIPEFENLKICCEFIYVAEKGDIIVDNIKNSKCCLVLTKHPKRNLLKYIKHLCDAVEQTGKEMVMAGGILSSMMQLDNTQCNKFGGAVITFHGEHLTARTFVVFYETALETSFAKMVEELEPLKPGYERLAFIFTCVDRYSVHEEEETRVFAKFFPNVPLHGFWSLGEFCLGYNNQSDKRKKARSLFTTSSGNQFVFKQVSAYLFMTYKK